MIMLFTPLAVVVFAASIVEAQFVYSPIIRTTNGQLRGRLVKTKSAEFEDVYQFTSIPFAEPPVGPLRFKKPVPKGNWPDVFDAVVIPPKCWQTADDPDNPKSEDCLILNIWVPKRIVDAVVAGNKPAPLSVFFWIHGGAYQKGYSAAPTFNGTTLAGTQNVIVVTTQYRLGGFGFLYLGTEDAPGNQGLWDQLEALKWTYNNIAFFGGNNSRITIDGQSAGASSSSFHVLSPRSRNYFSQAIAQSGTSFSTRSFILPGLAIDTANQIVTSLSRSAKTRNFTACIKLNASSLVTDKINCLRSIDPDNYQSFSQGAAPDRDDFDGFGRTPFVPVIDGDFFTESPITMNIHGNFKRMPLLTGGTTDEGSYYLNGTDITQTYLPTVGDPLKSTDWFTEDTFKLFIDTLFSGDTHVNLTYSQEARDSIEQFYWNQQLPVPETIVQKLVRLTSDYAIHCPTTNHVDVHAATEYLFAQRPVNSTNPEWFGCTHADELRFMFGAAINPSNSANKRYTPAEKDLARRMMTYFMNFVKSGDPNEVDKSDPRPKLPLPNWPKYTLTSKSQIKLINDGSLGEILTNSRFYECQFWNNFFEKYTAPSLL